MPGIEAIVLAAGISSRLGRPKALLDFDGRPALTRILDVVRDAGIGEGAVVVGRHSFEIRAAIDPRPLLIVRNPDPDLGRTGSVRFGLLGVDPEDDVLLWPVDRPLAARATVAALLAARRDADGEVGWIVPAFDGGRGHPIVLLSAVLPAILAAAPDESLRRVLRATGLAPLEVEVEDPGIHVDVDTPEAYERALAWWKESRSA